MKHCFTCYTLVWGILLACINGGQAQQLWPGDVNNNGIVNGVDWLYWGVAYDKTGAARSGGSVSWTAQVPPAPWVLSFPGGLNYAYADADGNGHIQLEDARDGIAANFWRTHGQPVADDYRIDTTHQSPLLALEPQQLSVSPGSNLTLDLYLGSDDNALTAVYGISFVLRYDPYALRQRSLSFTRAANCWLDPQGNTLQAFIHNDSIQGRAEITLVRTNHTNISGYGLLGSLQMQMGNLNVTTNPGAVTFVIERAMLINTGLNVTPVSVRRLAVPLNINPGGPCPVLVAPVCGNNGITYLNSCYAQAAGVQVYTEGVCYGDCIDPDLINPMASCPPVYEPVCGCNGVTYANECKAEAAGVTVYFAGPCPGSDCFDPSYILTTTGITVNSSTGIISSVCIAEDRPVCGCNGVTYQNACLAEASGITFYTPGRCNTTCVDPAQINPNAVCPAVYEPVCGCNGQTYANACEATAAGVLSFSAGICGGGSTWCGEATPLQCGDFLANESTTGAGNQLSQYACTGSNNYAGADRVYVLHKTTAGDLQIGLNIISPDIDLDLFLLSDNCSQPLCLHSSTTSGNGDEAIVLANAPLGVYYIVVDSRQANQQGLFSLEVSCGYLNCSNALPLVCGQTFQGSNLQGSDNVSIYGCSGSPLQLGNNGPERIHAFTVTTTGQVIVSLTGLTANLELYLLNSCDRGSCVQASRNEGTASESIITNLTPGTYYLVVDGVNGATSNYGLTVNCSSNTCNFQLLSALPVPGSCAALTGGVSLLTTGGHGSFLVQYSGPVAGSFTTQQQAISIGQLPPGTYTITVTDCLGCTVTSTVTVPSSSPLAVNLTAQSAVCMMLGSVQGVISGASPPYNITLYGQNINRNLSTNNASFTIGNLPAGSYCLIVSAGNGCTLTRTVTVAASGGNLTFSATPTAPVCGQPGGIAISAQQGTPPYSVSVTGPVSRFFTSQTANFNLTNLPAGTYTIFLEDNMWCTYQRTVTIGSSLPGMQLTAVSPRCSQNGSIQVSVSGLATPFTLSWTGPVNGQMPCVNSQVTIPNLPAGTYTVTARYNACCFVQRQITLTSDEGSLNASVMGMAGNCGTTGALWVDIYNGQPPFQVSWTGAQSGSSSISQRNFDVASLSCGIYQVSLLDAAGCSTVETVNIPCGTGFSLTTTPMDGVCEMNGSVAVNVNGSAGPFSVSWTGASSGNRNVSSSYFTLSDLPVGNYSITVTNSAGCSSSRNVSIAHSEGNLQMALGVNHAACTGNGSVSVTLSNGTGPYVISWYGMASGSVTRSTPTYEAANLPPGNYVFSVTDANWCMTSREATITNQNFTASLLPTAGLCGGSGSILVSIANTGLASPSTISWTGPASGSTTTVSNNFTIQQLPCGQYTVTITKPGGCSKTIITTVACNGNGVELVSSLLYNACGQYNTIWLDINSGQPPFTLTWSGPVNGSATTSSRGFEIEALPPGNYQVVVRDASGCEDIRQVTIFPATVNLMTATPQQGNCGAASGIQLQFASATPPYTIQWTGPASGTVTTSQAAYWLNNLAGGNYQLRLTDANGCTEVENVTVAAAITNGVNMNTSLIYNDCGQYNTIWMDIQGGVLPYVVQWEGIASGSSTIWQPVFEITQLPPGTYTVRVTDGNGCQRQNQVVIYPALVNLFTATPQSGCSGPAGISMQMNTGAGPYRIYWSGPVSGVRLEDGNTFNLMNIPAGNYQVVLIDANGCTEVEQVNVAGSGSPQVQFSSSPVLCDIPGAITVSVNGGQPPFTLAWGGMQSGITAMSGNSYTLSGLAAGTYTLMVLDANNCSTQMMAMVAAQEEALQLATSTADGLCGPTGTIYVNVTGSSGGHLLTWEGPNNLGGTMSTSGSLSLSNMPSGSYHFTLVGASGCVRESSVVLNNAEDAFEVSYMPITGGCGELSSLWLDFYGGSPGYTIMLQGPVSGTYYTEEDYFDITNLPGGEYALTIIDANGCSDERSVQVNVLADNLAMSLSPQPVSCGGLGRITVGLSGGQAPYQLQWTGPVAGSLTTSNTYYPLVNFPAGTYTFVVTDANGCLTEEIVEVENMPSSLFVSTTVAAVGCVQQGAIGLVMQGGLAPYQISWTGVVSGASSTTNPAFLISNLPAGSYVVLVSDINGCLGSEIIIVGGGAAGSSFANFSHQSSGNQVAFTNLASAGTYVWTLGDGTISTLANPVHTYAVPGVYTVCLAVNSACGSAEYCSQVVVGGGGVVPEITIGELTAARGSVVDIPVRVANCQNLVAITGNLQVSNGEVAEITGLVQGAILPAYNSINQSFSYQSPTNAGVNLSEDAVLFYIRVSVNGVYGSSSQIRFSNSSLSLSGRVGGLLQMLAVQSVPGSVTVQPAAVISGEVSTYWAEPIPEVSVHVSTTGMEMIDDADANGQFAVADVPVDASYELSASKVSEDYLNGLSSYGLFVGQRYLLGMQPPQIQSPYQLIAADVNCSQSFTAADLLLIQRLILGLSTSLGDCPSWVFIPSGTSWPDNFGPADVFPYATATTLEINSDTSINFTGVKKGDILGHAHPSLQAPTVVDERSTPPLAFHLPNTYTEAGETITLYFRSSDFEDIVSYQFGLEFDPELVSFVSFSPASTSALQSVALGSSQAAAGRIRLSWFSMDGQGHGLAPDEALFAITFRALQPVNDWTEMIAITETGFRPEAFTAGGQRLLPTLIFETPSNTREGDSSAAFVLEQNAPNPCTEWTNIRFQLPEASRVQLQLRDAVGRLLWSQTADFSAGAHQLPLNVSQLPAGTYTYTMQAGRQLATKRMTVVKVFHE